MNYGVIYDSLMERARQRGKPEGYYEKHHVLPKCLGGGNEKANLVFLTAKEHFMAHKLLVRIHPLNKGVWYALIAMGRIHEFKTRIFASERKRAYEIRRGYRYTDEARKKMSESAKKRGVQKNSKATQFGKRPPWNKGLKGFRKGYTHSEETRAKMRAAMLRIGHKPPSRKGFRKNNQDTTLTEAMP